MPSNLENHTTETMDELLDDDEFFYYAVPDPKQLRYIIGLYIIDSMWGGYDCEFAYIDIIYNSIKISLSFYYYVHFLYFIRLLVIHIIKPAIESSIALH